MILAMLMDDELLEVDGNNVILLDERRTVKVQVEEELEIVDDTPAPQPKKQSVKQPKPRRAGTKTMREMVLDWQAKNLPASS